MLVIYGICGVGATASLLLTANHDRYQGFVIVLVCLTAWLGLQHLGYNEFSSVGRIVLGGGVRTLLSAQLALDAFEREVQADMTLQQCWDLLCQNCPQFGFSGIVFQIDDVTGKWGFNSGWQARIDFRA